jgi:hypothetical protein
MQAAKGVDRMRKFVSAIVLALLIGTGIAGATAGDAAATAINVNRLAPADLGGGTTADPASSPSWTGTHRYLHPRIGFLPE